MKKKYYIFAIFVTVYLFFSTLSAQENLASKVQSLPLYLVQTSSVNDDWLVKKIKVKTDLFRQDDKIVLSNGLISRTFSLMPNGATIGFENLQNAESLIRSVRAEAQLTVNDISIEIGGLSGQPIQNYLFDDWIAQLKRKPASFKLVDFAITETKERFPWKKRTEWMTNDPAWPPPGKQLIMSYKADDASIKALLKKYPQKDLTFLKNITVNIHYEMYDGIPLICKWLTVGNNSPEKITVNRFTSEILATVEAESSVGDKKKWKYPNITIETDYAFGGGMSSESGYGKSYFWVPDTLYKTQVNYTRNAPLLLVTRPMIGPDFLLRPKSKFESFRTFELIHNSFDKERKGLAQRRMYRLIAPWVTENPILMHVRKADNKAVKLAIDQCADVGFELVIMTFGSGFNLENQSDKNLKRMKALADYAHSKGIALGGYSLLASRTINSEQDVVMPEGMKPTFGHSPCLCSEWGIEYFGKLYNFYKKTGQDVLEHDGSYPGDVCMSTQHPGHRGLDDSQWMQFRKIADFYHWCRGRGIYLNVPDWYFLNGSNKTGMGYRETNWSLPRKQQEIIERQNIYDGTWEKTPSMGWMFVPLVQYHGGGEAATIEPLKEHLPHYEQRLANLFGAGVQACYRGPRLYDAPQTREILKKWVDFYKAHRPILDSDIIHIRRPDGRDFDGIMHVNPYIEEKGLLMLYNPLSKPIKKEIKINLYYTGLENKAQIIDSKGLKYNLQIDRTYNITLPIDIPAHGWNWYVIR